MPELVDWTDDEWEWSETFVELVPEAVPRAVSVLVRDAGAALHREGDPPNAVQIAVRTFTEPDGACRIRVKARRKPEE